MESKDQPNQSNHQSNHHSNDSSVKDDDDDDDDDESVIKDYSEISNGHRISPDVVRSSLMAIKPFTTISSSEVEGSSGESMNEADDVEGSEEDALTSFKRQVSLLVDALQGLIVLQIYTS